MRLFRKKKHEVEWTKIGNFLLGVEKASTGRYLVCKNSSGEWSIRWGEGTMMFSMILVMLNNKDANNYLHSLLTLQYTATTYTHDLVAMAEKQEIPFMEGFARLVEEQSAYENSVKNARQGEDGRSKEDEKALRELKELSEMESELKEGLSGKGDVHG